MWKGARYNYWAWLIVAIVLLLTSNIGHAQIINGLKYQTFQPAGNGPWISPDRNTLTPLTSGTVPNIYYDWDYVLDSGRNSGVVVKFTGYFKATAAGTYTFGLEGDDGVQLIMKGQSIIDYWADQPGTLRTGSITLAEGEVVSLTLWFYENGGGARLRFTQQQSNGSYVAVASSNLATSYELWCNPCSPGAGNNNLGFESGTTTNWTISNGTGTAKTTPWSSNGDGVVTSTGMTNYQPGGGKTWTVKPYGTYMMSIQAGGGSPNFDPAMTAMGLLSTDITAIRSYLTGLGGNSNPTNASYAKRTVELKAGVTYTIAWQYMSTDYTPFNDGSIMTLVHSTDPSKLPTLNNGQKRYALLGFTNPGTGNYATDSYGSTGWQLATITVPEDGVYVLGFASFNLGDTALSPILFVDDLQGLTELNGQAFNPIPPNQGSDAPVTGGGGAPSWPQSDGITAAQLTNKTNAKSRVANIPLGNYIDLEVKVGSSNNSVTLEQSGSYNKIGGLGGSTYAIIDGDNNTINAKQGSVLGKNLIEFSVTGNTNTVTLWQSRNETTGMGNASDSGMHYTGLNMTGNNNTVSVKQSNQGASVSGHFAYIDITGNNNQATLKQSGNNEKTFFGVVGGASNVFDVTQTGTGSHYFDISLTGNSNNVTGLQKDSASHKATVNLINMGGANTVNLTQQGSTVQSINITQACANLSGCSVTVTQGNP